MLDKIMAKEILDVLLETGGDFAEVYEEEKYISRVNLTNGVVEKCNSGITYGLGLRIYFNESSVYAYCNDQDLNEIKKCAHNLAKANHSDTIIKSKDLEDVVYENINKIEKYPRDVDMPYKINYLKKATKAALEYDDVITKVLVSYMEDDQKVMIASSDGRYAKDRRVRSRIYINSVAEKDGMMQDGTASPGASMGVEFLERIDVEKQAKESARIAKTMLFADECPSGIMDVVINNGFGGVIFHEACGHSLEATAVSKNQSVFTGKLGQKIASDVVTAIDDGTIPNGWGSSNIDDEGRLMKKRVLIENGILKSYMIDQLNGRRMKMESTSSGRREDYSFEPTSRMTNTYIANGKSTFDEIISNTKSGLFAKSLGGGSVNPVTGDFNFAVNEGYLIKDGKIDKPLKGATLVGNGAKVLLQIDMVANNLLRAQGMCGSISGSIPVDVGQPTIRVRNMTVGGRGGAL